MNSDLDSLEEKIDHVLAAYGQLRGENRALRERLADLQQQQQTLTTRMDAARARLASLMDKLPQE